MFVLVTYDVNSERTEKFRRLLCRYLVHEQNSVFSGELSQSELMRLRSDLRKMTIPNDRLIEVTAANRNNVSVRILTKNQENGALEEVQHDHHKTDSLIL